MEIQNEELQPGQGVYVMNAGLVLVNKFIQILFERTGLTADHKFLNRKVQYDAVHYLQYVATGLSNTEEPLLLLNKVLCGLPPDEPIPAAIEIPEDHIQLIEEMIEAVINNWPSIGNTSVSGFRESFLVRNGLLTALEDKWELTVENKTYDILINTSPFSFSIIKYPWMSKPLYVNWPY